MRKGLIAVNGNGHEPSLCRQDAYGDRLDAIELYDLEQDGRILNALMPYAALLLPIHYDQLFLQRHAADLGAWLNLGGTMVINGHVAHPYADELTRFVPVENARMADYEVVMLQPHPVFVGVDPYDLTFRRGVSGFYGRGSNPPPPGALPLTGLKSSGAVIDWVHERPGGGRIFMHSGNSIWMYQDESNTSAARIVPQLIDWALGARP